MDLIKWHLSGLKIIEIQTGAHKISEVMKNVDQ